MTDDRLTAVQIRGFRCIEELSLQPHDRASVLVGTNASGKSSVLDAIQLVSDLVRVGKHCLDGDLRGAFGSGRLPLSEIGRFGGAIEVTLAFEVRSHRFTYQVRLEPLRDLYEIATEVLTEEIAGMVIERGPTSARALRQDGDELRLQPVGARPLDTILEQCSHDEVNYPPALYQAAFGFLAGICTLQLMPAMMRSATPDQERPDRYGRDLTARLARLLTRAAGERGSFLDLMEGYAGWTDLATPVTSGIARAKFREGDKPDPIALHGASDGTLIEAYLAVMALHPPPGASVMLVDEPATHMFPRLMQRPAELLSTLSTRRQILVATHGEELVGNLARRIDQVWRLERAPGEPTCIIALKDQPNIDEVVAELGIGEAAVGLGLTLGEAKGA